MNKLITSSFALAMLGTSISPAADFNWDGGDGTWDFAATNWNTGGTWTDNNTAVFGGTSGTVTLGADVIVDGLTFNTTGYIIDPDAGNLFDITFGTAGNINVSTGSSTINASIGGSSKITKTGVGVLFLRGANTFTGGFDIAGGEVNIAAGANAASYFGASSNTVTFTGDSILQNANNTVTLGQSFVINSGVTAELRGSFGEQTHFTNSVSGSGDIVIRGGSANFRVEWQNATNSWDGGLSILGSSGPALLEVNGFSDSAAATALNLRSDTTSGGIFIYNRSGTDALVFNNRTITLVGDGNSGFSNNRQAKIQNDKSDVNATITINTDLVVDGTGEKNFELGGSNSGDNTFAGAISDGIGEDVLNLYKQNGGKWILSGTNVYEGDTSVLGGTLELADSGQLKFVVGDAGINNQIKGTATVNLLGDFLIDLTAASSAISDSWTIVDVATLSETFGGSFSVSSTLGLFSESANVWSIAENGVTYEFSELTGTLTVVPEPSTYALMAGMLALTSIMLRRRRM